MNKHWDKQYRDGGSISSDRRFTEWDFNKLMASDKFRAVWSGNLWEIIEEGKTTVLGKFNPKTKSLYISGDKNMDNFLVVWMTENGFVNSDEYAILENGGGVGRNETQQNNFGVSYKLGDKFTLGYNVSTRPNIEVSIVEIMPSGLFFKVNNSTNLFSIKTLQSKGSTYTSGEYLVPKMANGGGVGISKKSVISELKKLGYSNDNAEEIIEKHIDIYEINFDDKDANARGIALDIDEQENQQYDYRRGGGVGDYYVKYDKFQKMWVVYKPNGTPVDEYVNKHNAIGVANSLNEKNEYAGGGGVDDQISSGGIKGKELWFSPYGEVKTEKRGTAKDYIEKNLAKSFGAEYMELVGEDEKDYIYELNGNPMMIAAKTAILQEETDLDIETYGRKKRVHIPKKSIDQISVQLRYPLITPFKNGGGVGGKVEEEERLEEEIEDDLYQEWADENLYKGGFDKAIKIAKEKYPNYKFSQNANYSDEDEIEELFAKYLLDNFGISVDIMSNGTKRFHSSDFFSTIGYANGGGVGKSIEYLDKKLNSAEKRYSKAIQQEKIGIISTQELNKFKNNVEKAREDVNQWYSTRPINAKGYANGGGVEDYDTRWAEMEAYSPYTSRAEYENKKEYEELAFASKTFSKTSEILVRENLNNGEICMCKLTKILGHEPNYPIQIVGSLKLEKCFMKRFYRIG